MRQHGFTLIELSIVLVIIGLIVGGVLVGQNLISAAAVRAQITQIEKFNTAANTFYGKYGYLPGDITSQAASQFGLVTRAGTGGRGDGNGEMDGVSGSGTVVYAWSQNGENLLFWEDLSSTRLIDGSFTSYVDGAAPICTPALACSVYIPGAKIGNGNNVYVYSGYVTCCNISNNGPNFFGLSVISAITNGGNVGSSAIPDAPGITVAQAQAIDIKMDDGLPTSGRVLAQYLSPTAPTIGAPGWAAGGGQSGAAPGTAAAFSSTSCYDNGGAPSGTMAYSVTQNNGANVNCALSFRFQ